MTETEKNQFRPFFDISKLGNRLQLPVTHFWVKNQTGPDLQTLLRNETQNQKEMDMKIFIFDKMEPKMEPYHFSSFWHCAWQEKCIFPPFSFPGCSQ